MILLIDNYDSFSYNLYQLIGEIDPDIKVIRNNEMTVEQIKDLKPDRNDPRYPDLRCLSRSSGDLRGVRCHRNLRKAADARQAVGCKI